MLALESSTLQMRVTASIVEDPRGGPIRKIINGRHRKPTGRYASVKARRSLPWEDVRELHYFYHCEADSRVVSYLAQPHRLEISVGRPLPLIYFPDVRRDMATGPTEIREVKKRYDPADDADYDLKLKLAAEIYAGLGWSFAIVEASYIEDPVAFRTATDIQRHRDVRITALQALAASTILEAHGGVAPFATLVDALGGGPIGEAYLHALIVRRHLSVNVRERLGPGSPVELVEGRRDTPCRARVAE